MEAKDVSRSELEQYLRDWVQVSKSVDGESLVNSLQTYYSVTFYFMEKTQFLILAGSAFYQI